MTTLRRGLCLLSLAALCTSAPSGTVAEADWPMWRHDASRTGASSLELPAELHLQWKRELPPPRPAFPDDLRVCFDASYEPVVMDNRMFLPSMVTDSVTALNADTGEEEWTFHAEGPVRFAPLAWEGRLYFVADDGFLYCLEAKTGKLLWRFDGLPPGRGPHKFIGNSRLISRWPARGGPVLADGTVYFATGIWPIEGVCVYAVNARTGRRLWRNTQCSLIKNGLNDHGGKWDTGLSPQGYLTVAGEKLVVPSGRALPGFFDRKTGLMEPYSTGWGGRMALAKGCWYACTTGRYLFLGGSMYGLGPDASAPGGGAEPAELVGAEDFARLANLPVEAVERWMKGRPGETVERDGKRLIRVRRSPPVTYVSPMGRVSPAELHVLGTRPRLQLDPATDKELGAFREVVLTDQAIYYSRPLNFIRRARGPQPSNLSYADIVAYDIAQPGDWVPTYTLGEAEYAVRWETLSLKPLWSFSSSLKVHIKAGGRLYAGGPGVVAAVDVPTQGQEPKGSWKAEVEGRPSRMLAASGKLFVVTEEGALYCFGGQKAAARVHAIPKRELPAAADEWTERAKDILNRTRITSGYCLALGWGTGRLAEELARQSDLYVLALEPDAAKADAARRRLGAMELYGTRVHVLSGDLPSLELPPYLASLAVCENPVDIRGRRGKALLERLFASMRPYGGTAVLPLSEQEHATLSGRVAESKLAGATLERAGELTLLTRAGALTGAADWTHQSGDPGNTFTSRDRLAKPPFAVLWFGGAADRIEGTFPSLISSGRMFLRGRNELHALDIYTGRQLWTAAVASPGNCVAVEDAVYIASGHECMRLDPATGARMGAVLVPEAEGKRAPWREIRISGDHLIGTAGRDLLCMNRHSGAIGWRHSHPQLADFAVGAARVFCVDSPQKRDDAKTEEAAIVALDAESGKKLWGTVVKPTAEAPQEQPKRRLPPPLPPRLTYCDASDILLLTVGRSTVAALKGKTDETLWSKSIPCQNPPSTWVAPQPPILLPRLLITHGGEVYDPQTGLLLKRHWGDPRGCARPFAGEHIVTMRDGQASFFDLATGQRTLLRGTRSGCQGGLFPAGGLLNAFYLARHCTCNYPLSTSLALVPMPEAAGWAAAPR
ncbi:MAG: hypothetical protein FJ291_26725 [Planctomycetes bacterium]|nr:hypothetical protein [Planctomycetota bacterium]